MIVLTPLLVWKSVLRKLRLPGRALRYNRLF
jgi:hypothetical protein